MQPQQPQVDPQQQLAEAALGPAPSTYSGRIQDPQKIAMLEAQLTQQEPSRPSAQQIAQPARGDLLERFGDAFEERVGSVADTLADFSGLTDEQNALLGEGDPLANTGPGAFQAGVQMLGDTAGLIYDVAGDTISYGVEEAFRLLPEEYQEDAKQGFKAVMDSPLGQAGLQAWKAGESAWSAFEKAYPQEAKTLSRGLNLVPMARTAMGLSKVKIPTELTPLRLEKVGLRQELKPPSGRDKDVYNIITPDKSKQQKVDQLKAGGVTNPGASGTQRPVPSASEWEVIDEVKKLGNVGADKTYTHNFNIMLDNLNKTNEQTRRLAAKQKGGVQWRDLESGIEEKLNAVRQSSPAIFGVKGKKGKNTEEELLEEFYQMVDTNGNSWEGILKARQDFDNFVTNKIQVGTYTGRKASVASEVHKAIRETANGFVKEGVPQASGLLRKQHNLFRAMDGTVLNAAQEASTAVGRILQTLGLHMPHQPLSQAMTITSPLVMAGTGLALAVSPALFAYKVGVKPITKGKVVRGTAGRINYTLRDVISEAKKAMKLVANKDNRKQLGLDIQTLTVLANSLENAEVPPSYVKEENEI